MHESNIGSFSDYTVIAQKTDGMEEGVVCKKKQGSLNNGESPDTLYFLKKMYDDGIMREFIGASIARVILGEAVPKISLLKDDDTIWTASKEVKGFITLEGFLEKASIPYNCFPNGCFMNEKGEVVPITTHMLAYGEKDKSIYYLFKNASMILKVAEFVEHGDVHERNLGVVINNNENVNALVDFSLSLQNRERSYEYNIKANSSKLLNEQEIFANLDIHSELHSYKDAILTAIEECGRDLKAVGLNHDQVDIFVQEVREKLNKKLDYIENEIIILKFLSKLAKGHTSALDEELSEGKILKAIDKIGIGNINPTILSNYYATLLKIPSSFSQINGKSISDIIIEATISAPNIMSLTLIEAIHSGNELLVGQMLSIMGRSNSLTELYKQAICEGNIELVKKMLHYVNKETDLSDTIIVAFTRGHSEVLNLILDAQRLSALYYSYEGKGILEPILSSEVVNKSKLIEADQDGKTLLHHAALTNRLKTFKLILDIEGIDKNILMKPDKDGKTPFHYAASSYSLELVKLILDSEGIDKKILMQPDKDGRTPFHYLAPIVNLKLAELILGTKGIDKNILMSPDKNGQTPFHYAVSVHNLELAKLILDSEGIDKKILMNPDESGKTPLHYAASGENLELAKLILAVKETDKKILINPDEHGRTPFHYAVLRGNIELAKLILNSEGIDKKIPMNPDENGETPLHYAVLRGDIELAKLILNSEGIDKKILMNPDKHGKTPFHYAVSRGNIELAKLILDSDGIDKGILMNPDEYGETPLHYAVSENNLELLKLIEGINKKPNIDQQITNSSGPSAAPILLLPTTSQNIIPKTTSQNLLGTTPQNSIWDGKTTSAPLQAATKQHRGGEGILEAVPYIINYLVGGNLHGYNYKPPTLLHKLAYNGQVDKMIKSIKEYPALMKARGERGETPFQLYLARHEDIFYNSKSSVLLESPENKVLRNPLVNEVISNKLPKRDIDIIEETTLITNAMIKASNVNQLIKEIVEYGPGALKFLSDEQFQKIFNFQADSKIVEAVRDNLVSYGFEETIIGSMRKSISTALSSFVSTNIDSAQQAQVAGALNTIRKTAANALKEVEGTEPQKKEATLDITSKKQTPSKDSTKHTQHT